MFKLPNEKSPIPIFLKLVFLANCLFVSFAWGQKPVKLEEEMIELTYDNVQDRIDELDQEIKQLKQEIYDPTQGKNHPKLRKRGRELLARQKRLFEIRNLFVNRGKTISVFKNNWNRLKSNSPMLGGLAVFGLAHSFSEGFNSRVMASEYKNINLLQPALNTTSIEPLFLQPSLDRGRAIRDPYQMIFPTFASSPIEKIYLDIIQEEVQGQALRDLFEPKRAMFQQFGRGSHQILTGYKPPRSIHKLRLTPAKVVDGLREQLQPSLLIPPDQIGPRVGSEFDEVAFDWIKRMQGRVKEQRAYQIMKRHPRIFFGFLPEIFRKGKVSR